MSDCGDKSKEANETGASGSTSNHSKKYEKNEGSSESGPVPSVVSFSMAHALSMLRQRQKNHEDSQEKKDEALEIQEKAREKRRRRRKNQKLARAKFKAKQAVAESESHDLKSDSASTNAASSSTDINEEPREETKDCGQLKEPQMKKRKELDNGASVNHLPMKKRFMKLEAHEVDEAKQGILNHSVSTCQETSTIESSNKKGKSNIFIPRAIMLKKKKRDTK